MIYTHRRILSSPFPYLSFERDTGHWIPSLPVLDNRQRQSSIWLCFEMRSFRPLTVANDEDSSSAWRERVANVSPSGLDPDCETIYCQYKGSVSRGLDLVL
jgi:hypothetical protein